MVTEIEHPTASERLAALPDPPEDAISALVENARDTRWRKILLIAAGLGMSLGMIGAGIAWSSKEAAETRSVINANAASHAQQNADKALAQASTAVAAADEANRRLKALGKPTVPVPTITPVQPPPPVTDGLSASQVTAVQSIIRSQLAGYQLPAATAAQIAKAAAALVPKPKDGHTPTVAELQPLVAAVHAKYCADGKCTPKPGADGTPGRDGSPGVNGKDAPPVTDAQLRPLIAEGFAAYCGQESKPCEGERGPSGPMGPAGPSCPGDELPVIKTVLTNEQPVTGEKVFVCPVG